VIPFLAKEESMIITIEQALNPVPVAILKLDGKLDASSYQDVIASGKQIIAEGARNLLLDISDMSYMSSSGIVAIQTVALLMRGEPPPDPEHGWSAMHTVTDYVDSAKGLEKHFKILSPQPPVRQTLAKVGFDRIFEIHTDREAALASFAS
jgi:anti-anti-sigma regulatory factor